jgi:hypothetical protein
MGIKTPEPEQLDRELAVVELRREGKTWQQIADVVNYATAMGAWKAYQRACQRTLQEPTDEARRIELDRLDALQRTYWEPAVEGNLRAADFVLRVIDRRARILGIDAPQKIQAEVVNYDGTGSIDAEVDRIARIIEAAEYAERERSERNNNTTIIEQPHQSITVLVEDEPSAEGTTTA